MPFAAPRGRVQVGNWARLLPFSRSWPAKLDHAGSSLASQRLRATFGRFRLDFFAFYGGAKGIGREVPINPPKLGIVNGISVSPKASMVS